MLRLNLKDTTPPGSYRYEDKDTGMKFRAMNLRDLTAQVVAHRSANNLPIEKMSEVIEDWLCKRMPVGICVDELGYKLIGGIHRTAETTVGRTVLAWKKSEKYQKVSQEEAERRALTCNECEENVPFAGCSSCRGISAFKKQMLEGKKLKSKVSLYSCGMTGFLNDITVFLNRDAVIEVNKGGLSQFPLNCWLKGK